MPRKLLDQQANEIRNNKQLFIKSVFNESINKKNFVWVPAVKKEIGINQIRHYYVKKVQKLKTEISLKNGNYSVILAWKNN